TPVQITPVAPGGALGWMTADRRAFWSTSPRLADVLEKLAVERGSLGRLSARGLNESYEARAQPRNLTRPISSPWPRATPDAYPEAGTSPAALPSHSPRSSS